MKNSKCDIDAIILASDKSGLSFDLLYHLTKGLDANSKAIVLGNSSVLPRYIKSKLIPVKSQSRSSESG